MDDNSKPSPSVDQLIAKIRAATIDRHAKTKLRPARFVLALKPGGDDTVLANRIAQELAPLKPRIARLHPVDCSVLVLVLPNHVMRPDHALAFEAAYALIDRYDLENAEADIETDFYAEPTPASDGRESTDFPPGCWVDPDPELTNKWRWAPEKMSVPSGWAYSEQQGRPSRGEGITIAQPDTGVARHSELLNVKQAEGYDFVDKDHEPVDPLEDGTVGHGTATASVAVSPEAGNVIGTAPRATHMPLRAIETVVRISQVRVAEAINYAVDHDAHVITMSLGGLPSISLDKAVRRAVEANVIVLAAAGNCVGLVVWPARYDICCAVAGTNHRDAKWKGTCKGSDVDISAPAENVYRAKVVLDKPNETIKESVVQGQGTSFAVALTAGVAACWLAHHGRANLIVAAKKRGETLQAMFVRLLRATARRPAGWDSADMGAGIVDARKLLEADFDLGRDRETAEAVAENEAGALGIRRFVTEAISAEAARAPVDWDRHGPEIAAAILNLKRGTPSAGDRKLHREEAAALPVQPDISRTLREAAAGTELGDALGVIP